MNFAAIDNGFFRLETDNGTKYTFPLTDEGNAGLAEAIQEHNLDDITCSSSVDFPDEYGAPDMDVRAWIDKAFGPAPVSLSYKVLTDVLANLKAGKVDETIERMEGWKKLVEKGVEA